MRPICVFAVVVCVLAMCGITRAATSTSFAQFSESTPGGNEFEYLDNGVGHNAEFGSDAGGVFGAPIPVDFTFLNVNGPVPADLQGVQHAMLTLTSNTDDAAATAGPFAVQTLDGSAGADTLMITRDTPAGEGIGTRTNLLKVTFSDNLLGALGGATPELQADSELGDTVTYSSDFVGFASSSEQDFSLTFSSWTSAADNGGLEIDPADMFFNTATAAGTGTFDSLEQATVIPEPAAGACILTLGLLVALASRRRIARR